MEEEEEESKKRNGAHASLFGPFVVFGKESGFFTTVFVYQEEYSFSVQLKVLVAKLVPLSVHRHEIRKPLPCIVCSSEKGK